MEPVRVRVLGPLQLGGDASLLRSGRLRRLLAILLVHHGSVVSADRLAQVLWGDQLPADPAGSLHTLVWRLRGIARAAGCDGAVRLLTTAPGYLMEIDGQQVDAVRFERLVGDAATQPPERGAAMLEHALAMWRGRAYAEFCDEQFALAEAARLEELRATAVSEWAEAAMALGRGEAVLGKLESLVAAEPLRERPRAQLMRALHGLGRDGDALQVFRDYRDLLAAELGLDPPQQLRDLERAILRRELAAPRAARDTPPPRPANNLRLELTELIGRADDVTDTLRALEASRVVTLTGAGGVGKTRLALQVAADAMPRYADGTWVVELAGVTEQHAVPYAVATALGVRQRQGSTATGRLVDYLNGRSLLLVLDNCEHVRDAAADLVDALAPSCPGLQVLATSREPLGIDGERVLLVPPLPVPPPSLLGDLDAISAVPSVALFCRRAAAASPAFALSRVNVAAVAEICRRLDGLPLALELAATRVRSQSPEEITSRLERPLRFLHTTQRVRQERHRTLAGVIDWSYRLLTPAEQRVFERCSVFLGTFTLDAVASVTGRGQHEVADIVDGLVAKSMLVAHTGGAATRFGMLETLRAYGRERLAGRGDEPAASLAHARYHAELAEAAAAGLCGQAERGWLEVLAAALDDMRSAHRVALSAEPALAIRLSAALFWYGEIGAPSDVPIWAARAADAATAPDPLLPVVLAAAAGVRFRGDFAGASALAQRALAAVAAGHPVRRYALHALAEVALYEGRLDDVAGLAAEVGRLADRAGDTYFAAHAAVTGSLAHGYRGDTRGAVRLADDGRRLAAGIGNRTMLAWADYARGEALLDREPDRAREALESAAAAARAAGNRFILGVVQVSMGSLHARYGDPYQALPCFAEAVDYWSQAGNVTQQWITLRNVIELLMQLRAPEQAAVIYGAFTASSAVPPAYGADATRLAGHAATMRADLGVEGFTAALARGRGMGEAGVVPFARAVLASLRADRS